MFLIGWGNPTWDADASLFPPWRSGNRFMLDDGAVLPLYQQMDIYGANQRLGFQALPSEQLVGAWMSLR